ncbi:MAG: DUF2065 domain-containing protein [Deltaproteobacteria bacterium]|nr:DUF2065 domain-containing protein [Deltaproteobacteria bacterium]
MEFLLCVLGVVMILEGMPYFAFPSKVKSVMREVANMPDSSLRVLGFVLMAAGLALVYAVRR